MIDRSDLESIVQRLKECITYLRDHGVVHTQQNVVERMHRNKSSVSRALNGDPQYLTEDFIECFTDTFKVFNYDWIVNGSGDMLSEKEPGTAAIINNQVGNGNHFGSDKTVNRFLDELAAQRELTKEAQQHLTKSQEQIDRLITIIEQLKN